MAFQRKKICISKSYSFIGLVIIVGLSAIFLNYRFLQTKPKTSSRASKQTKTQTAELPITSDPKKILDQWIKKELRGNSTESSLSTLPELAYLTNQVFLGEVDYEKNYSGATDYCALTMPSFNTSPLGIIFAEARNGSGLHLNRLDNMGANLKLSFYKKSDGKIDAYLFSYIVENENEVVKVIKYIPYDALLNAFSYILKDVGYPLTSETYLDPNGGGCDLISIKNRYLLWRKWATHVSKSYLIADIYIKGKIPNTPTPTPTRVSPSSAKIAYATMNSDKLIRNELSLKIEQFNSAFKQFAEEYKIPEAQVGPYIYLDLFGRIHVTYFIDSDPLTRNSNGNWTGNYAYMKTLMATYRSLYPHNYISGPHSKTLNSIGLENCKILYTTDVCTLTEDTVDTQTTDSKTFINHHMSLCRNDVFAQSVDYYSTASNCPQLGTRDIKLLHDSYFNVVDGQSQNLGLFMLHLKPLDKKIKNAPEMRMVISVGAVMSTD